MLILGVALGLVAAICIMRQARGRRRWQKVLISLAVLGSFCLLAVIAFIVALGQFFLAC